MNGDPSTPYSRDLGDELRQVRERYTTFRARRIARMLGWDPGKVSKGHETLVPASYEVPLDTVRAVLAAYLDHGGLIPQDFPHLHEVVAV